MSSPYTYGVYVDGVLRYIGKGHGQRRYFHVWMANYINHRRAKGEKVCTTRFYNRLAKALNNGASVVTKVFRYYATDEDAFAGEIYRIARATGLWNKLSGGQGFSSEEARIASKEGWESASEIVREKRLSGIHSNKGKQKAQAARLHPKAKAKFKASMRSYWESTEFLETVRENGKNTVKSGALRQGLIEWFNIGGGREVIAESNRRRMQDHDWATKNKNQLAEARARNNANPAFQAKRLAGIQAYWKKKREEEHDERS